MPERVDITRHVAVIGVSDGPERGLVYTDGFAAFGERELEIANVPLFLHPFATGLLNQVMDWRLNRGGRIHTGKALRIEPCEFRFVESGARWRLSDDVLTGRCANPSCGRHHAH